jgi:hypothetical protein
MTDAVYKSQQCDRPAWSLEQVLQDAYDSEINLSIHWEWNDSIFVEIGIEGGSKPYLVQDELNTENMAEMAKAIVKSISELYPNSAFALKYRRLV